MQDMPIGIFRGDDTDAFSYQTIVGTINTDLDLTGCKAVFRYLDFSMEFDPIPEDRKLTIVIPADETKKFPAGLGYASLRVYDSENRLKTFSNRIMVFVATKTPMFGSDEFEVDFNVRASLEPLKFFVGPNPDDFDEYRGYLEKVIDRASASKYGLAILLDAIDSDLGADDGVAATPVAVKAAYAAIIEKLTDDYYTAEQTDEAIDRVAAYYITYDAAGNPFPTHAALANAQTVYSGGQVRTPTRNDYCVVLADETHQGAEYRYIYAVADGETTGSWQPQFPVEGVMTVDQTVTKNSQNPVSGGGVWSAIWGTASTAFSSLYDWVVAQLGLKRDYTDLSYDTTETVEVPALHSVMTVGGQTIEERDLLCTEEVPDPPQIGHTYTWRSDGAAFYVTQGVSALQTTWILYSQNGEALDGATTQNATQGFYPDVDFRPSGAVITIHKTTAQKQVTTEDELALKSEVPAPSTATPAMDGTGAAGTSAAFARGDHVHPSDTSRMAATATGADIAVSGTDATMINAALAGKLDAAESVEYAALVALRNGGNLVPGQQYRITNYVATVANDTNAQSANHPFDIVVTADDEHTLNEHARAIRHDGDTYFAGCNLAAWDVWYCLDNDATRFGWADSTNGKGVIYRLVDEFQNDVPYDFKGIQFKAYGDTDNVWRYTFDSGVASGNTDYSLTGLTRSVYKNTIAEYTYIYQRLHCIVFKGAYCYSNTFGADCHDNTFGAGCYNNTFGVNCYSNTFGSSCQYNTFNSNCRYNTFGSSCNFNTFGSNCYRNTFGSSCNSNTFDSGCQYNTFGSSCYSNTFGSSCYYNTFGSSCYSNTLGSSCQCNTFGPSCYTGAWSTSVQRYVGSAVIYNNVLRTVQKRYRASFSTSQTYLMGETLYYDSQYWECVTEHIGAWEAAHFTEIQLVGGILSADEYVPLSYYRYVELEDGVSYVALDCTADRGRGVYYQNVTVSKGVVGTSSVPKHIEDANYSQTSKTTYQPANSQVISV